MYNHIYRPIHLFLISLVIIVGHGIATQPVYAQSAAPSGEPVTIAAMDTSEFPTVGLTLAGASWPSERASAPLQIQLNGEDQTILSDEATTQGIQLMVAIDPNDLFATDQTRYTEMTGALLDLIENNILLRNQDWLAAYLLAPDTVQSIQPWTQEPNLVFNSIIQNRPAELTGTPLTAATLIAALQAFDAEAVPNTAPRTLLLISAGAPTLEVGPVVEAAQTGSVQIHAVQLVDNSEANPDANPLAQLAQSTGGQYLALESPSVLPPLWERIAASHQQRTVTFQASVTEPQTLVVRLPLPDGTTLSDNLGAAAFANLGAVADGATPAAQTVLTSSAPEAAVVNQPANTQIANQAADTSSASTDSTEAAPVPSTVAIPGLQLALPRSVLQVSLPVLLLLIGYLVYAERRDRRKKSNRQGQAADRYQTADPLYNLDEASRPRPTGPFQLQTPDTKAEQRFAVDLPPVEPPVSGTPPVAPAARLPARLSNFTQDFDESDATMRPPRFEDEEATYRMQHVDQPVLGYLVRASSDPNLPKELPIYGLNPAPGQVRQIHIGRHSKHNTVVINDKSISREHAVIVQREGRLYLRDNASTSGTFLNWKRLNPGEEMLLRHNDLVSFGQIAYEFRLHGEDEVTIAES